MTWGLIVRSERDRGLGIQTKAMFDNLHPDKTLVVINKRSGFESHPEDYPGAEHVHHRNEHGVWKLDETAVRDWWKGLDVVVSVETLYDWRMVDWAKADGVRTVVHGNPEFWMATNPQPDVWWWPTTWRTEHLPHGPIVPVPVSDGLPILAKNPHEGKLRITHVAGSGAMEDRNGANAVRQAKRRLDSLMDIDIYSQVDNPVADRWDMYRGYDILLLPRRYGGLCLPALEAMVSGLMVIMPDCSPNHDWSPVVHVPCEAGKIVNMQTGPVQINDVIPNFIISMLRRISREEVEKRQMMSREWSLTNNWSALAGRYHDEIDIARLV